MGPTAVDPSTTVFVGSITPGISDGMLRQLLSSCGTLVNLKRISPAFGFASFDHPEAVMRAIQLLNGLKIPTPANSDPAKEKSLVVKADEKTKAFIEQYKVDRGDSRSDFEQNLDSTGQHAINSFLDTLRSPQALAMFADSSTANSTAVPAHLRDLPPEDLPEEHRSSVLGEIDKFRQASAAREEEKRRRERVLEREQARGGPSTLPTGPRAAPGPSTSTNPADPQSFTHGAPAFVSSSQDAAAAASAAPVDPEEADEAAEARRKELKAKDDERRAKEVSAVGEIEETTSFLTIMYSRPPFQPRQALTSYASRERNRLTHWTRVHEEEAADAQRSSKLSAQLIERSEKWDQAYEESRELFWVDRPRWRHFRGPMVRRELEEDEADVRAEKEEAETAAREAEKFLARQQEEMKRHIEEQRSRGVLVDGSSMQPLKLNFGGVGGAEPTTLAANGTTSGDGTASTTTTTTKPHGVLGDEDDPSALNVGRGKAIPIDLNAGLTPAQKDLHLAQKRAEIRANLSTLSMKWDHIDAESTRVQLDTLVEENVGERVPELVDVLVEAVKQRQGRERIRQLVEPVMAEDAEAFTDQVMRILVEESWVAFEAAALG